MAYVKPVNFFGMLSSIGDDIAADRLRTEQKELFERALAPAGGGPAAAESRQAEPGFFDRIVRGENPFIRPTPPLAREATQPAPDSSSDYFSKTRRIENPKGDPYAVSPTGAVGVNQFLPSTFAENAAPGESIHGDQKNAMERFTEKNNASLVRSLGRVPTAGELYVAHRYGADGARRLLANPNATPRQLGLAREVSVNNANPDALAYTVTAPILAKFEGIPSPFGKSASTASARLGDRPQEPVQMAQTALPAAPGRAAATQASPNLILPNASVAELAQLASGPYGEIAKLALKQRMSRGEPSIQEIPVNDESGKFLGKRKAYVSLGTDGRPTIIPFGGIEPSSAKNTTAETINFEYAQAHPEFQKFLESRTPSGNRVVGDTLVDPSGKILFEANPSPGLTQSAIDFLAERAIAGDTSGLVGLGRGAQGAQNLVAVQNAVDRIRQERGLEAQDIISNVADLQGRKSQARVSGTMTGRTRVLAEESVRAGEIAIKASDAYPRGDFTPLNKAIQMVDNWTSDPKLAELVTATTMLSNIAAKVANPSGVGTDATRAHYYDMLSTAKGNAAYNATVKMIKLESETAAGAAAAVFNRKQRRLEDGAPVPDGPKMPIPPRAKEGLRAAPWKLNEFVLKYGDGQYSEDAGKVAEEILRSAPREKGVK